MACGNNHTLAVTEDGQLYACGSNDFGQLGHDGCRTKLRMYIYDNMTLKFQQAVYVHIEFISVLFLQKKLQGLNL